MHRSICLSTSRVNFEEIKLQQQAVGTDKDGPINCTVNHNGERAEINSQLNLSNRLLENNNDKMNATFNEEKSTEPKFHGLLSDRSLVEIADNIGAEWNLLACTLGISLSVQERLQLNNPHNSQLKIVNMLRLWRDRLNDDESVLISKLCNALLLLANLT